MQVTPVKNFVIKSLVSFLALAVFAACSEAPAPKAAEPKPIMQGKQLRFPAGNAQLALLKTTAATTAETISIDLPAHLVWNEERTQRIYAPLAGRVDSIRADLGQAVAPGSALLNLSSPEFGLAQADAAKALADLQLSEKALRRQRELFEAGIVARKDLEQVEADALRAKAEADRASAKTRLYGGSHTVNQQLALTSGIRGLVVERNVNPGQEVRPDQSGPGVPALFVLSDPSQLWVQIDAREADIAALRPGASFELSIPTLPGQKFTGKVAAASDFLDPTTRTIKVRGVVANPQRLLKSEMLGTARIQRKLGVGVMVPASGVFLRGATHWVFLQTAPGTFEPKEVTVGHEGAKETLVTQGLSAGDVVVSENGLLLAREFRIAEEASKAAPSAAGAK
jgi:cobalt-zinc-cadmium efflux system membrane fusion protein